MPLPTPRSQQQQDMPAWLALVKAVEQLAAAGNLADIIAIVRATARDISGADGICFVLRDGERCHYVEENAIGPLWKGKRFPLTACISGWCMLHDELAAIPDIYADPRIPHDAYRPTFVKSLVMVPVRTTEPVAAIGFYWAEIQRFCPDELVLIEALGRSTSAALGALQSREELAESERRLSMALKAGGLGAFELDLSSGDMIATADCRAIFGITADAPFSRWDLLEILHPDHRDRVSEMLEFGSEGWPEENYRIRTKDGERRIDMQARLILDINGRPTRVTGVVRDVTDRYRATERIDNLRSELLRAARLNDLGAMASALAHELNQPLAAGTNYLAAADRLLTKDPGQASTAISKAAAQLVRTKEIVQRIRGFVGQGQSERRTEDMETVCREVLELGRASTRYADITAEQEVEDGLPQIVIDKVQIQQVLLNLLRNAVEAMSASAERKVRLSVQRIGEMIEVRVADTGPGLAPEIADHLFQPFHTTKEGGMGVGLSLCRKIVESHGGKLWYEPGRPGAIFAFSLPLTPP